MKTLYCVPEHTKRAGGMKDEMKRIVLISSMSTLLFPKYIHKRSWNLLKLELIKVGTYQSWDLLKLELIKVGTY